VDVVVDDALVAVEHAASSKTEASASATRLKRLKDRLLGIPLLKSMFPHPKAPRGVVNLAVKA
jgi:hypothetical protein